MNIKLLLILLIFTVLSACLQDGNETIILPEVSDGILPEEISTEWNLAIRCLDAEEDAIEAVMNTQSNDLNFTATGNDYDGQSIDVTITGVYDKTDNTISAEVRYDFTESGIYRIDHFAVDLDFYVNGTYIDMIKLDESYPGGPKPGCDTQIKLFFE
jgi:hypothetical protein